MLFNKDLLPFLVCPECNLELKHNEDANTLECPAEKLIFKINQGIVNLAEPVACIAKKD